MLRVELRGPRGVEITESFPGEGGEPRHFIRRAIYAIKTGKAIGRSYATTALKAFALTDVASLVASRLGCWSPTQLYDPLPDFLELRELAHKQLGPVRASDHPIMLFRAAIDDKIARLRKAGGE